MATFHICIAIVISIFYIYLISCPSLALPSWEGDEGSWENATGLQDFVFQLLVPEMPSAADQVTRFV